MWRKKKIETTVEKLIKDFGVLYSLDYIIFYRIQRIRCSWKERIALSHSMRVLQREREKKGEKKKKSLTAWVQRDRALEPQTNQSAMQSSMHAASTKNVQAAAPMSRPLPLWTSGSLPPSGRRREDGAACLLPAHHGGNGEDELPPGVAWRPAEGSQPGAPGTRGSPRPTRVRPRSFALRRETGAPKSAFRSARRLPRASPGTPRVHLPPPLAGQRHGHAAQVCPHPPRCDPQPQLERSPQAGRRRRGGFLPLSLGQEGKLESPAAGALHLGSSQEKQRGVEGFNNSPSLT